MAERNYEYEQLLQLRTHVVQLERRLDVALLLLGGALFIIATAVVAIVAKLAAAN